MQEKIKHYYETGLWGIQRVWNVVGGNKRIDGSGISTSDRIYVSCNGIMDTKTPYQGN